MRQRDPAHISPTAHYTGYVWRRHGLSPPELGTTLGRGMFWALEGPMRIASRFFGGLTLETMLIQRHRIIDHLLERAIVAGSVQQVVEVAAGLSARGWRFTQARPDLVYVEGDLPAMVENKRAALPRRSPHHHVIAIDALVDSGPASLAEATAALLDPSVGTAIITEGLLPYFAREDVLAMWRRFARFLGTFPRGLYLSDLHIHDEAQQRLPLRTFQLLLGTVVRGEVHVKSFASEEEVITAVRQAGFATATIHRPRALASELELPLTRGPDIVNIVEAQLTNSRTVAKSSFRDTG